MNKLLTRIQGINVPIREKRAKNDGTGKEWVTIGYRTATVEVTVDMLQVLRLAEKAANNKSKRSRIGPISAKATFDK